MVCPRCGSGVHTAARLLFECDVVDESLRNQFNSFMVSKRPNFLSLSIEERLCLLMASDSPSDWDTDLYRYLRYISSFA